MEAESYTKPQLEKIYEILSHINKCNNADDGYKYDAVKCFTDAKNNFYISFYRHGFNHSGPVSETGYWEIDRLGRRKDLKEEYSTALGVSEYFDRLTPCDLTKDLQ